jgi:hypothetical protein
MYRTAFIAPSNTSKWSDQVLTIGLDELYKPEE